MIDHILDEVLRAEGGYVNNPKDPGGETNWGITVSVARENGYRGSMKDMPQLVAREIYYKKYVVQPGFDKVLLLSPIIAGELIDTGVNMGTGVAAKMFQRCLNAFNRNGKDYVDIAVDGAIGPGTIKAFRDYLTVRKSQAVPVLLTALNCLQGARYIDIVESRPASEDFVFGWINNRVKI